MKNTKRHVVRLVLMAGLGLSAAGVGSRARAQDVKAVVDALRAAGRADLL